MLGAHYIINRLRRVLYAQVQQIEEDILTLLLPKDRTDERGVILEVRAGTGGEEAALFAADLFNMYQRFAEQQRWKFEVWYLSPHSRCPDTHLHAHSMLAWQSCGSHPEKEAEWCRPRADSRTGRERDRGLQASQRKHSRKGGVWAAQV